ncbi:stealth family protein [Streptomyces sp. NPDC060243]|uniref:stealth family protein n=1 Tax=Streptomyces sp. NPDC060243 TaxID=3347081 RepID=UPI00365BD3A5
MPGPLPSVPRRLVPTRVRERRAQERAELKAETARLAKEQKLRAARAAMFASDAGIREFTVEGRSYYGRTVSSFTAEGARADNLHLVTDALDHAGVGYFLVPGRNHTRHVVGVLLRNRRAFLAALRELYRHAPVYMSTPDKGAWPEACAAYVDGPLPTELKRQTVIRFNEVYLGPDGQVLSGFEQGCEVEFWQEGEALLEPDTDGTVPPLPVLRTSAPPAMMPGALVAPRTNAVSDIVPADARSTVFRTIQGRAHPTFADFAEPVTTSVDFPLDVVYTWVDGDDPELADRRARHREVAGIGGRTREAGASRYTSRDELRYSLRSLEMNAPFVRNIYIVTDGQVPSWLDTVASGVRVVDHKEIFDDPSVLPVFNSHAIGTQLHHISGLSERYLYFNDDIFVGRPITAGHFFHGNGIARIPFSPNQYGLGAPHPDEPAPNSAGKNVRTLMAGAHGRMTVNKFLHTPHPQMRSVMREIEERYPEAVARTAASRFRSITDIAMGASTHHHHAYFTGRGVPGKYRTRYVDVAAPTAEERMEGLLTHRDFDFFCLNDVDTPPERAEEIALRVRDFLETYFPFPSRWELPLG